jgi:hypothetical protein
MIKTLDELVNEARPKTENELILTGHHNAHVTINSKVNKKYTKLKVEILKKSFNSEAQIKTTKTTT